MAYLRWTLWLGLLVMLTPCPATVQGHAPYPKAITDRLIHKETLIPVPPRNHVIADPDFGSLMVRASDETTNSDPGGYLRNSGSGEANAWSADGTKFYATGQGGRAYVFGFRPATMKIVSPIDPHSDVPVELPLRPGPTFSSVDPDLIYGTTSQTPFTISSYRISTGVVTTVADGMTCRTKAGDGSDLEERRFCERFSK